MVQDPPDKPSPYAETSKSNHDKRPSSTGLKSPLDPECPALDKTSSPEPEGRALQISIKDADVTLAFMREHDARVPPITPAEERRLSRKVFLRVFALTWVICLVCYTDKATLSLSTIMGLYDKTHLNNQLYNDANTLFYVGFLLGQIPSLMAMQYLPLNRVLFGMITVWACLTFLMCAAYNPAGVLILRFALGFVESTAVPILTTTNGVSQSSTPTCLPLLSPIVLRCCEGTPVPGEEASPELT